jgi:hypothetical protein
VAGSIEETGPLISQLRGADKEASNPGFIIRLDGPGADGSNNVEERPNRKKAITACFFILSDFQ